MKTIQQNTKHRVRPMSTLIVLAVTILFGCSQDAFAQQWTPQPTPNGNNIYYNSGTVGIGTTAPEDRLHVAVSNSNATFPNTLAGVVVQNTSNTNNNYSGFFFENSAGGYDSAFGAIHIAAGATGGSRRGALAFGTAGTVAGGVVERMRIDDNGNVGIGTMSPLGKLHIQGDGVGNASGVIIDSNPGIFSGDAYLLVVRDRNSNQLLRVQENGKVGIGTTSPGAYLSVNPVETNPSSNVNLFEARTQGVAGFQVIRIPTSGSNYMSYVFHNGSITVDGNINAKYQDMAEWVPTSEQIPAGTVVALDPTKSNHVISSTQAYDTRVAGVISEQPGIALGERGDGKVLVATTGRVKVNVDATKGPIHIGDLLVTSDVPGVAMKSEPVNIGGVQLHRPGTLIGKALEPLEKGSGKILVLLSLQ